MEASGSSSGSSRSVISTITHMFTSAPRVRKLLNWKQGDEDEKWAEIAVDVLIKRIQKHKGKERGRADIECLEQALANPTLPSKCITIPRSMDGRIQVSYT